MVRKRLLLLLKPLDAYPSLESIGLSSISSCSRHKVLKFLDDRRLVHKNTISFCQNVLNKKAVDCKAVLRSDLREPIRGVDLVISIGGDGTLLQASHFMDDSVPVLGVNSDPTRLEEVEEFGEQFDATRSTGYLCAGRTNSFEQLVDDILQNRAQPSEVSRMAISVNSELISTFALNDVLVAHPCPATVSRFSFRISNNETSYSSLNCRSSGLRVSTAAGSTAAMLSAGGFRMPILSEELQYFVREPISPGVSAYAMHGLVKFKETMDITWFCREGNIYIDGSHVVLSIQRGDTIELSSRAPKLKVYLPGHLLSQCL